MPGARYSRYLHFILLLSDLILLNLSLFLSYLYVFRNIRYILEERYLILCLFYNMTWILVSSIMQLYGVNRYTSSQNIIIRLTKAVFVHAFIMLAIVFIVKFYFVSRYMVIHFYALFFILAALFRALLIPLSKWYRKAGFNYRKIIIIGAGSIGNEVMNALTSDLSIGLKFLGFFDDHPEHCLHQDKIIGTVEAAKDFAISNQVDEVIVALPDIADQKIKDLINFCENHLVRIKIVPDYYRHFPHRVYFDFFGPIPLLYARDEPLQSFTNRLLKRGFDLVFSVVVMVILFPWFVPFIGLLIKLGSKGPVFFRQNRSGLNNKVFKMWKFRTMILNTEADDLQAKKNDQRITSIGRFLRKTNLDELPQFMNVFIGEMSVVGPRPHMLKHTEEYSKIIDRYMVRHFVKPGLTGWAQVTGSRGETGLPEKMAKRVEKDVWYIEHWSFLLDLRIIIKTIKNMIFGDENAI